MFWRSGAQLYDGWGDLQNVGGTVQPIDSFLRLHIGGPDATIEFNRRNVPIEPGACAFTFEVDYAQVERQLGTLSLMRLRADIDYTLVDIDADLEQHPHYLNLRVGPGIAHGIGPWSGAGKLKMIVPLEGSRILIEADGVLHSVTNSLVVPQPQLDVIHGLVMDSLPENEGASADVTVRSAAYYYTELPQ